MTGTTQLERPIDSPAGSARRAAGARPWRPRIVVVGLDGSPSARRALARAGATVADEGLLVLVAVEPELFSPGVVSAPLLEARDGDSARVLAAAREQVGAGPAACVAIARRGDPAAVLADVVHEHGADLLVVGRRGRDFAARVLLGSVAERVIAEAPCDVLVVA